MARGVNKVILIGNLGDDPSVRYMPNGNAVANFTVAVSENWKDQQGQQQERTEWCRIVAYKRLAEIAGEYLRKGAKVYIEGKLQTREWTDQQGVKRYTTEIIANEMQMLDGKPQGQQTSTQQALHNQRLPQQNGCAAGKPQQQQTYSEPPMDFDDDIPFAPLCLQCPELINAM